MAVQEELRHERANKDKIQREKDQTLAEKYSYEQEVAVSTDVTFCGNSEDVGQFAVKHADKVFLMDFAVVL